MEARMYETDDLPRVARLLKTPANTDTVESKPLASFYTEQGIDELRRLCVALERATACRVVLSWDRHDTGEIRGELQVSLR